NLDTDPAITGLFASGVQFTTVTPLQGITGFDNRDGSLWIEVTPVTGGNPPCLLNLSPQGNGNGGIVGATYLFEMVGDGGTGLGQIAGGGLTCFAGSTLLLATDSGTRFNVYDTSLGNIPGLALVGDLAAGQIYEVGNLDRKN